MKKAVILTGSKQYLVSEGDILDVDLIKDAKKTLDFEPLILIDGEKVEIGAPRLSSSKVTAEVVNSQKQADKVLSIRYKAKKRVKTIRGHRQQLTTIKVTKIS